MRGSTSHPSAALARTALALLVLVAAVAPPQPAVARTQPTHAIAAARSGDDQVLAHHELVRAPAVADARGVAPIAVLRPASWRAAARPTNSRSADVARVRARRAFTRPRVRIFRPSDPDDF